MAVGGDDQVRLWRNLGSHHEPGIGLHHNLDACSLRSSRKTILAVMDHDARDLDAVLAQHIESHTAKMAGADEGNPHDGIRPGSVGDVDSTAAACVARRE